MDREDYEVEEEDYVISPDKLYGVVELVVDAPNEEGESEVEKYSCVAASNWLQDVKRLEDSDGHVKYVARTCKWPILESKLNTFLDKRSTPGEDWITYRDVLILKFCRSLGLAKVQAEKAICNSSLSESDTGLQRKRLPVVRYGCNDGNAADDDSDTEPPPMKSLRMLRGSENVSRTRLQSSGILPLKNQTKLSVNTAGAKPTSSTAGNKTKSYQDMLAILESGDNNGGNSDGSDDVRGHSNKKGKNNFASSDESDPSTSKSNGSCDKTDSILTKSKGISNKPDKASSSNSSTSLSGNSRASSSNSDKGHDATKSQDTCHGSSHDTSMEGGHSSPSAKNSQGQNGTQVKRKPPSTPTRRLSGGQPRSFSPRKLTSTLAPVSNFVFKKEMGAMMLSLNALRITANKIYNCVCPITETIQDNNDNRGMPAIPVDSLDNLIIWEKFLMDHDNTIHIVRLLTERCLASTLKDSVYGMLKFIMSNKVACVFNAKGKNKKNAVRQKLSFQDTRSCTVMAAALQAYKDNMKKQGSPLSYSINTLDLVTCCGLWLKDAPKRYLNDLKGLKEVPDTQQSLPEDKYPVLPENFSLDFDPLE